MRVCGPTTNHEEIRNWAERSSAFPAQLKPNAHDGDPAILRFAFSHSRQDQDQFETISWEMFFKQFDLLGLSFVYLNDAHGENAQSYQLLQIESKSAYRFDGSPI